MPGFLTRVLVNPRRAPDRTKFPFSIPSLHAFDSLALDPQITFFVGENGAGKSTLMEAIAILNGCPAEGGSKSHQFSTYDSHSDLHEWLICQKTDSPKFTMFLRAESFYNLISYSTSIEGGALYDDLHRYSHGEGFQQAMGRLLPHGFYMLDEPESALSVQGQLTFLVRLKAMLDKGCQFVIATHSPIILGIGIGTIYQFSPEGIHKVDYEETEPFLLTHEFLKNRRRFLKQLGLEE